MKPDEIKKLGFDHYIIPMHDTGYGEYNAVEIDDLEAYTAAVEARERERCADICQSYGDEWKRLKVGAYDGRYDMMEEAASIIEDEIRELK